MPPLQPPDPTKVHGGGRFVFRPWELPDASALAAAWHDPLIVEACAVPPVPSLAAASRWISGWARRAEQGLALDLVVADPTSGSIIGEVGLRRLEPGVDRVGPPTFELGWWIGAEWRAQGLGSAAVGEFVAWADEQGLGRLVARIPPSNLASASIAVAAGMQLVGCLSDQLNLWTVPEGQSNSC